MLTKSLIPVTRRLIAINKGCISATSVRFASKYDVDHHHEHDENCLPPLFIRQPTIDDLPHPCGPWQEHYSRKQNKYNTILVIGIASVALSLVAVWQSKLFHNILTPARPADKVFDK